MACVCGHIEEEHDVDHPAPAGACSGNNDGEPCDCLGFEDEEEKEEEDEE
jgi:hypothetical protein